MFAMDQNEKQGRTERALVEDTWSVTMLITSKEMTQTVSLTSLEGERKSFVEKIPSLNFRQSKT